MTAQKTRMLTGILLSLLLFFFVAAKFFGLPVYARMRPETIMWVSRIACWVALLIIYLYARNIEKENFLLWPEKKLKPWFFVVSIIVMLLALSVVLGAISFAEKKAGLVPNNKVLEKLSQLMCGNKPLLLFTCLTAGFTEELMFRGYLQPRLQVLFGKPWIAIVVSSLLFGLGHFGYGDFNRMFFPFLIGIAFSVYYYKYRNLAVLITCHFLIDFISLYGACK